MNLKSKALIVLFHVALGGYAQQSGLILKSLNDDWVVRQKGEEEFYSASVPGSIHKDLLEAGVIEDPYYRDNEFKCQWIENEDWVYSTEFNISEEILAKQVIEIHFEGLDTYASVYLNDTLILDANNMFRSWSVNVKELVLSRNSLRIEFRSVMNEHLEDLKITRAVFPAPSDASETQVSPFVRKAPFHFGWDWAPRLVGCGIWKPIEITAYDTYKISNVGFRTDSLSDDLAYVTISTEFQSAEADTFLLRSAIGELIANDTVIATSGFNQCDTRFVIKDPELWWPIGHGEQAMQDVSVSLSNEKEQRVVRKKFGIRTSELINDPDLIGRAFTFLVNGKEVFVKGANIVPVSSYSANRSGDEIRHVIDQALAANMNMLRVWGGGVYGCEAFYEYCDQKGIMVWQDFMFACGMYHVDDEMKANINGEVRENIKRIANHPSLVLWCGNNEIEVAWNNWGWQEQYNIHDEDSARMWHMTSFIFDTLIPKAVTKIDRGTPYISSSPQSNWGTPGNFDFGNMHYWGVWHGEEPIDHYALNVGRFMSEYGMQSYPNWSTIQTYTEPEDRQFGTPVFDHHQKSYKGDRLINEMVEERYGKPKDTGSLVMLSQVLQAEAMKIAIDAHRVSVPHCMGTLYWQLNDVWPGPSWSTIDHSGTWKGAHYSVKEAFKPTVVLHELSEDSLHIFIMNEISQTGDVSLVLLDVEEELNSTTTRGGFHGIDLSEEGKVWVASENIKEKYGKDPFKKGRYAAYLIVDDKVVDIDVIGRQRKAWVTENENVKVSVTPINSGAYQIDLLSDTYIEWGILQVQPAGHLSDNYFSLFPGQTHSVQFIPTDAEKLQSFVEVELLTLKDLLK